MRRYTVGTVSTAWLNSDRKLSHCHNLSLSFSLTYTHTHTLSHPVPLSFLSLCNKIGLSYASPVLWLLAAGLRYLSRALHLLTGWWLWWDVTLEAINGWNTHAHVHTHTHTCTHTNTSTHTHAHSHTHTCTQHPAVTRQVQILGRGEEGGRTEDEDGGREMMVIKVLHI